MNEGVYTDILATAIQKLSGETSFSEVKSWSAEEQMMIYTSAFTFYQQKSYEHAEPLFLQLCMASPFVETFWRGLASSLQMLNKWKQSLQAWCISALLADQDPIPHFHAAECFYSMNDKEEASKALVQAEKRLDSYPDSDILRTKIALLKELLASR